MSYLLLRRRDKRAGHLSSRRSEKVQVPSRGQHQLTAAALSDAPRDLDGLAAVALSVDQGRAGVGVPEDDPGGLDAVVAAQPRGGAVAELVRRPVRDAEFLAGTRNGLRIGVLADGLLLEQLR